MKPKPHILPVIIASQFACTSLWFAGNAIVGELATKTGLGPEIIGYVLSSVQFGFIIGTLAFGLFMVADRFSPSRVFLVCSVLAALCNFCLLAENLSKWTLLLARFGTGFFLAGIYPVGMKIAADYYREGLGRALGYLVGALVLGTAFPYFVGGTSTGGDFTRVIQTTSVLSLTGGFALWALVPNGPYRKPSARLNLGAGPLLFKLPAYRQAAFGYFGHMWELYAFWAFTPLAVTTYNNLSGSGMPVSLVTGTVIALGGLSCVLGGWVSLRAGSRNVAVVSLAVSGLLCILSPLLFAFPLPLFLMGWLLWGMAVTADSPQFSNLIAASVPPELKGTALTLVNCIGFAISILSIETVSVLVQNYNPSYAFIILALGPLFGLLHIGRKHVSDKPSKPD
ncbi:MFS transporter [Pseudozobellia thermophila]|uniref:Predicted arabinose efflux permease, MFS family n=1 Tax=Pseudozobellia thermophila TaxID=192903 RepID=A0A1M6FK99_9FLAO|nr:MFS transporter [Pseudozobellia thermophila]SHI98095.1 Predicted arabinose efflux permease, MFS family [Pseudozobellia thermophila]